MQELINIRLSEDGNAVIILDQRLLPNAIKYIEVRTAKQAREAIALLKVRGAPAIGIFAGYAMYILSKKIEATAKRQTALSYVKRCADYLIAARPTAVNLKWAVERMLNAYKKAENKEEANAIMLSECKLIHEEDIAMCKAIAEHGLKLIKSGDGVLTHCNAGALATSKYGTGLGALVLGAERGNNYKVFVDETRPLLQGARITTLELMNAGLDVTLICDNMANAVMRQGKINAVFVGADRVSANGDVANKIGTSGLAVLAKRYNIPFYVFCPSSTIDVNCKSGADIIIEERDASEITELHFKTPIAPKGVKCYNPAFDVTENELITAVITEKGRAQFG